MMNLGISLQAKLNSASPRLVTCWLMIRVDGARFAFTTWDEPFLYAALPDGYGDWYLPTNSMDSSANSSKTDLSVNNANVTTLYSDTLLETDLKGGLFDSARVWIFWIDPWNTGHGIIPIQGGRLGEIVFKNLSFETELRGSIKVLQQSYGPLYTTECQAFYGDATCMLTQRARIWRSNFTFQNPVRGSPQSVAVRPRTVNGYWYICVPGGGTTGSVEPVWPTTPGATVWDNSILWQAIVAPYGWGTVTAEAGRGKFTDAARGEATAHWQYGQILWTGGANLGLQMDIGGFDAGGTFYLQEPMPNAIRVGDTYTVLDGCAKTRTACSGKGNIVNFQGYPDMPVEAQALSSPNLASPDNPQQPDSGKK